MTCKRIGSSRLTIRLLLFNLMLLSVAGSALRGGIAAPVSAAQPPYQSTDPAQLEDGDLLLRQGQGLMSTLIASLANSPVSHCGIVVNTEDGWKVIHSVSGRISDQDGIRIERLEEFCVQAEPGTLRHVKPRFRINRDLIRARAMYYLAQNCPFDHSFDLSESRQLYCTELVRRVYLDSGAPDVFHYKMIGTQALVELSSFLDARLFRQVGPGNR